MAVLVVSLGALAWFGHTSVTRDTGTDALLPIFGGVMLCAYYVMSRPRKRPRPYTGTIYRSGNALDDWPSVRKISDRAN